MTRSKVLKKLGHPACMNYAIISPDSSLLAAVGDESSAYFYSLTRDLSTVVSTETGEKLSGWTLDRILCIEMELGPKIEDKCCFTIAFSQSNRLCAIGSQSGVITVFDVRSIQEPAVTPSNKSPIVCYFNSSRSCFHGGAVRCMSFSPEPWDLLVWLEDKGHAGIADVRQDFMRRQILEFDANESNDVEEVDTEPIIDESTESMFAVDRQPSPELYHDLDSRALLDSVEGNLDDQGGDGSDTSPLRESLIQDLTSRERTIVQFLNTARWSSGGEDDPTDRAARDNANAHPPFGSRTRRQGLTSGADRAPRPTSPRPVIHPPSNHETRDRNGNAVSPTPDPQPSITLSWTTSPDELRSATLDTPAHPVESSSSDQSGSSNESGNGSRLRRTVARPTANFDYSSTTPSSIPRPRNHQRSRSVHRRPERQDDDDPTSLRTNLVAFERLRRQRQLINEADTMSRNSMRGQRYTQQPPLGIDHGRSSRIRSVIHDHPPEHTFGYGRRDSDPNCSAGLGFGADGRSL